MSRDTADIPFVPFDPRKAGPLDLARAGGRRVSAFVDENSRVLIGAVAAVVCVVTAADAFTPWRFTVPAVPNIIIVWLVSGLVFAPSAWILGRKLGAGLYGSDTILISEQDPITGNQRLIEVTPDTFREMTVVTNNGDSRDTSYLQEVVINGQRAYEVDQYYPDLNAATASWQAGVPNTALRRDRRYIKKVKTTLEKEADKTLEAMVNYIEHVRGGVQEIGMQVIAQSEGVVLPEDHSLHERLADELEDADVSEELLGVPTDSQAASILDDLDGDSATPLDPKEPDKGDLTLDALLEDEAGSEPSPAPSEDGASEVAVADGGEPDE